MCASVIYVFWGMTISLHYVDGWTKCLLVAVVVVVAAIRQPT